MAGQKEKSEKMKLSEIDETVMELFDIKRRLGKGAYGVVWKAIDKKSNEVVAVKKIFDAFRDETDAQRTFREIIFLKAFRNHINVVKLLNVHRATNDLDIYLIFEYMESDLHNIIKKGTVLKDVHKRYVMYQLISAVRYIHSGNVIHRDLKPSNILIDSKCKIKLADFGLSRSVANHPVMRDVSETSLSANEFNKEPLLTDYVATRWYRAPEILIASKRYTKGIDMWSLGCILGEMLRGKALFPGSSTINQIEKIVNALPTITQKDIDSVGEGFGSVLLSKSFSINRKSSLPELIGPGPADGINLVESFLKLDPMARLTSSAALMHPYVHQFHNIDAELVLNVDVLPPFRDDVRLSVAEYRAKLYEMVHIPPNPEDLAIVKAARLRKQHKHMEYDKIKLRSQLYSNKPQLMKSKCRIDQSISSTYLPKTKNSDMSKATQPAKTSKKTDSHRSKSNIAPTRPSDIVHSNDQKRKPTPTKSNSSLDSNKSSSMKDRSPSLANRSTTNGTASQNFVHYEKYYNKPLKMADPKCNADIKPQRFGNNFDIKVKPSIAAFQEQMSQAQLCRIPSDILAKKTAANFLKHKRHSTTKIVEKTSTATSARNQSHVKNEVSKEDQNKMQNQSPSPRLTHCYEKRLIRLEQKIKLYHDDVVGFCKENFNEAPELSEEEVMHNMNVRERVKNMLRTQSMDRVHSSRSIKEHKGDMLSVNNIPSVPKAEPCSYNFLEDCARNQRSTTSVGKMKREELTYVPLSTNRKEIEALTYAAGLRGSGDNIGYQRSMGNLEISGDALLRSRVSTNSSHYCTADTHEQSSDIRQYRSRPIPANK